MKMILKNCKVVNYDNILKEINIIIENGIIKDVTNESIEDAEVIDCSNLIAVPGLIDMHVHFRDPGLEYKEDIESGSKAAVAGGVTTCLPMANTKPVNDNSSITRYMVDKAKEVGLIDLFPVAAITKGMKGEELTEMGDILEAGAIAFSDDGLPVMNSEVMRRALEYASQFGSFIISHPEDKNLAGKGVINEGKISTLTGLKGIPDEAEEIMIARDILLAKLTKAHMHLAHVSTKGGVELIKWAKSLGINVTAEAAPHHFSLTEDYLTDYDTNYKMNPPLRTEEDKEAIIEALKDGTIDVIATDHAPHHKDEKFVEFDNAAFGITGLQTLIPLTLKLVEDGKIDMKKFVELTSYKPAQILKLNDRGYIAKRKKADITLIDINKEYIFDEKINKSKSTNSPFFGKKLKGATIYTIKNGKIVYKFQN
ncbi:dihydroorotase [Deferribacter desulfuricans SSM1]|uniref:Dihydroorotase n=1 Tax=Deferribacter desulfuricans (strain DSM 14783 / JCM 11476 / NBRC 101012 / SSM1) TaxID=639282 RepID=D3PCJ3_DEFDS|nr:dihydroorotase [Deferribacter desulfuricans]BAI80316.1 dihydroorotase [Deferribacter desulfuricans SSM1]